MYENSKIALFLKDEEPLEEWRQTLLDAANIIRARGLAKWQQEDCEGRVCVMGALSIVAYGSTGGSGPQPATKMLNQYLRERGVTCVQEGYGCAPWNNEPERTASEVIAALESCARAAREAV